MALYSYIVTRDFGFAPNPFPPYCTLATCKPLIRRSANINDWIIGVGSAAKESQYRNKLIFAMQVQEKLTFDQYWNDPRFLYKRPVMNGSKKQMYGDNVYHSGPDNIFIQEDSHHSFDNGLINQRNYDRDLPGIYVLISNSYWYWGRSAIELPLQFHQFIKDGIGQKKINDEKQIHNFANWLNSFSEDGYIDKPISFSGAFTRYNGK
jgi:hypothetical protein